MSVQPTPDTKPQGLMDLPQVPYDAIRSYAAGLRDPNSFRPQTKPGTIDANGNVYRQYSEVNHGFLTLPFEVNFPAPIDGFAFEAMTGSVAEHLQVAVNSTGLNYDQVEFMTRTYKNPEDLTKDFAGLRPPRTDFMAQPVKAILVERKSEGQKTTECVLYLQPTNSNPDKHDKHEAITKTAVTITDKGNPQALADFFASYVLSGFPWPKRE